MDISQRGYTNLSLPPSPYILSFDGVTHKKSCSGIAFISQTFLNFLSDFKNEATQEVFTFQETHYDVLVFQLFWSVK